MIAKPPRSDRQMQTPPRQQSELQKTEAPVSQKCSELGSDRRAEAIKEINRVLSVPSIDQSQISQKEDLFAS